MIAPATPADLDAIEEIERHSFPRPWPRQAFEAELAREDAHLIVARAEPGHPGRPPGARWRPLPVIGFCNYRIVIDELHIHSIATHPDHRRAGTGGRLVAHALDAGRARGCTTASLEVRRGNVPAIALYQRAGFRSVHVRARYYQDNGEDALVMVCDLTAGRP